MTRARKKKSAGAERTGTEHEPRRLLGLLVFAFALVLRLLFWHSISDAGSAYSAWYKGDAPVWIEYAKALQDGREFELGLPLRPPGNGYLIAALWNGEADGISTLRFVWCLMGALTALLVYAAALRAFGLRVAAITGFLCAASTGLMVLQTSLNNETPYLVLVAAVLYLWEPLRRAPRLGALAAFAALNALACLVRVEHALFFGLLMLALLAFWTRAADGVKKGALLFGASFAIFGLVLLPWQLHAMDALRRFNHEPPATHPATEQAMLQVENALAFLHWHDEATAERDRLPAFLRRTASNFVAATVAVRGSREVQADDFTILKEAFGAYPEPVGEHPFVVIYGGLNFYLANNERATAGFNRKPLENPPPLAGGPGRYPNFLIGGLPPPQLALTYPPHLEIVNHGYAMGWAWIRANPSDFFALAFGKLRIFWQGAAQGLGGYNLPLGMSGPRRAVDIVVPDSDSAGLWRLAVLLVAAYGGWTARRRPGVVPWVLFAATKVVVTVAFYGYARQGASLIPILALLMALAVAGAKTKSLGRRTWLKAAVLVAVVVAALEGGRTLTGPEVRLDGRSAQLSDPFPVADYMDRRLEVGDND